MKRLYATIKQYDYSTETEFLKHKEEMYNKGYKLISNDMFGGMLSSGEMKGSEKFTYTAAYIKSPYM